ncbi:MAG: deoxyribonuclease IV [Thermoanaerobaculia bacterium]
MTRLRFPDTSSDLIGAHISTKGGVHTVFGRAVEVGATAVALFTKNSNQWNAKPFTDEHLRVFAEERAKAPAVGAVFSHAAYLINLATTNPEFHRKSVAALKDELTRAAQLGLFAVVLHPGAHMGAGVDAGIDQIARSLDDVHASMPDCEVVTLLETSAGQGSSVGCTFEELGRMLRLVDHPSRVGVCFDTCHVFASGYEIRTRDGYERTIDALTEHVGLENVGAFHLNDSKKGLCSRVDRHHHIGEGEIGTAAFELLLNDPRFRGIPKVLETPKGDSNELDLQNLGVLRSLMKRKRKRAR